MSKVKITVKVCGKFRKKCRPIYVHLKYSKRGSDLIYTEL